jgi:ATP-dependent helicase/nuclease subunit B
MILAKKNFLNIDTASLIEDKINAGKLSSLLVIVPTNRKSRALKKEYILASGGKVSGKINIDTIGTFSQKMHEEISLTPLQILSEAASAVLLKRAFTNANVKYFNRYKSDIPAGTLSRVKNIISEYKRHGISPDHLFSEALSLEGSEKLKAEDIAAIYKIYNEECKKTNSGETGDIYFNLLSFSQQEFEKVFRQLYPQVDLVVVNGFDEFTGPEIDLIDRVANINGSDLFLSFDYDDENRGLFLHLQECYNRFKLRGFHIAGNSVQVKNNLFHEVIKKEYFNDYPAEKLDGFNITELTGLNREREVEIIAKEIKELILNGDTEPGRICVAFNLIQNYSPLIRDKFTAYGIPYNLTDRIPLSSSGPVTAIITLLEILENDFYYKSLFRALCSGFITIKNISVSDLLKVSAKSKIVSGYNTWIETLEQNLKSCDEKEKYIYERAIESVKGLGRMLFPLGGKQSIPHFRNNLLELITQLRLPENILKFTGEPEYYLKALSSFYEILAELFSLLISEYGNEKEFPLNFFLDAIRTAAQNSRFNILEKPGYGVQVTNLNEIRGLSFDYVFIGGLIDGELPTRYTPEIFFSGSFSREEWRHQVEERYHFYQSLCTWEKGLYLSKSLQDGEKELVPSNFLSELKNHFLLKEKNEKDFSGAIYSNEDLLEFAGRNYDNITLLPGINIDALKDKIRISELRKSKTAESEFNGFIYNALSDDSKAALYKTSEREYSASQLEVYALCPFKFFLERVLYLNVLEEPVEELESLEFGSMIHKILYLFYRRAGEEGLHINNCSEEDFQKAEDLIFRTADEVISEYGNLSPLSFLEIEKLTGLNGNRKKSVLYNFLLNEHNNNDGFTPFDFEVPFGKIRGEEGEENRMTEFRSGNVKLRGKIDRIDIDHEKKYIRVTDYKLSGTKPSVDDLENGLSLQLPIYLYAAGEIIKQKLNEEYSPACADIYSLKYQKKHFGRKPLLPGKNRNEDELSGDYENIISICRKYIDQYVSGIEDGVFNLSVLREREKKVCGFCDYNFICRIEENK